jgi:phosphopantetheinyl transferase (holo-ACP synthase)
MLSEPLLPEVSPVIVRRITASPDEDAHLFLDDLAERYLHPGERLSWQGFADASDGRRWEWLMGRIAAKEAVDIFLQDAASLSPQNIQIATTAQGAPFVVVGADVDRIPGVSITHSRGVVVAAAGEGAIGIDVELADRDMRSIARVFTEAERSILAAGTLLPIHLMVAKEAAAKATGQGLGGSVQRWPIIGAETATDLVTVGHVDHPDLALPVRLFTLPPFVLGLCAIEHEPPMDVTVRRTDTR